FRNPCLLVLALFVVMSVSASAASASVPPLPAFWWLCCAFVKSLMVGVVNVGLVSNTTFPVPVSSERMPASVEELVGARLLIGNVPAIVRLPVVDRHIRSTLLALVQQ